MIKHADKDGTHLDVTEQSMSLHEKASDVEHRRNENDDRTVNEFEVCC